MMLLDKAGELLDQGKPEAALKLVEDFLQENPVDLQAWHIKAGCLKALGRLEEAVLTWQELLKEAPIWHQAWYNLGNSLRELERRKESLEALKRACELAENPDYFCNLGIVAQELKDGELSLKALRRALALKPAHVEANFALATHYLRRKEWRQGFARYEWRKLRADSSALQFPWPCWQGEELGGKEILLHAEQGFGDVIHFARFIPLVLAKGGRISLLIHPELRELMANSFPETKVYVFGENLPTFPLQAPLLSLPFILKLQEFPQDFPYLKAKPLDLGEGKKIGICWQGNPRFKGDKQRSLDFAYFKPFLDLPSTKVYSLQYGVIPPDHRVIALPLNNFQDTANLIAGLDAVVTVDTAVAHLAGALGIPGQVLVPFANDWRWGVGEEVSFWYPSLRLLRGQEKEGL